MFLTLKALHLITTVAWFAAMFYLPRLFVYHCEAPNAQAAEMLITMERRLYRAIMTPAALLTLVFGIWLTALNWAAYHVTLWFWVKLGCVLALFAYHGMCGGMVRKFGAGANQRSQKFYRVFNEIPLIFLVVIVFLAIFKPTL
ncbi:MAG: protoporphyrinogen oxidase HemJ [Gammaproteobacteria bacterium]|nr:protoporphyrinogen oxidase HemJ [Gammaproteobacteria bacterium]